MRYYKIIVTNKLAAAMFTSGERVYNVIGGLPEGARLLRCELINPTKTPNLILTYVTDESNNGDLGTMNNPIQLKPVMEKEYHQ